PYRPIENQECSCAVGFVQYYLSGSSRYSSLEVQSTSFSLLSYEHPLNKTISKDPGDFVLSSGALLRGASAQSPRGYPSTKPPGHSILKTQSDACIADGPTVLRRTTHLPSTFRFPAL